jgi:chitosanase
MDESIAPFDAATVNYIRRILSVAETGAEQWPPGAVYIYNDGPGGMRQVTLSIGFTEMGGNLKKALERYCELGGALAIALRSYLSNLGDTHHPHAGDSHFIQLLHDAGKEEAMAKAQIEMFEKLYMKPAFDWASEYGFKLPLSYAVIADSFLHSGSMLGFLMNSFSERKPNAGGDEKTWIGEYLKARKHWLANHSNHLLRNTVYRVNCYLQEIEDENWNLSKGDVVMNGTHILPTLA